MYNHFQLGIKYIKHLLTASNSKGHGMHSPFVFDFITKILNDKNVYDDYNKVESLRKRLLKNTTELEVQDFGAGSGSAKSNKRTVASITKTAAKPKKYVQLLYRMVKYYNPDTITELGTSLGISCSYLSLAKPDAKLITMEGAPAIAAVARQNFINLSLQNIELVEGNFDETLPLALSKLSSVDFGFIDGNHRQLPTERYFNEMLPKVHNDSILVFDDIHWSREMEAAWNTIKSHPSVRCTVDLFFIGIVFFRNEFKERVHYTIRF